MPDLSDEELIGRYRVHAGGPKADPLINELFQRYHGRVALWCLRFTGDRQSAADMAQDVFMKAFRNLRSFRGESKFSTWLYSVARNHCFSEVKARALRREQELEPLFDQLVDPAANPHQLIESQNYSTVLRGLVKDALTEVESRVMTLHYGEEVPLDAITSLLNLQNASGAKAYIVSARRKLERVRERWQAQQRRTER